MNLCSRRPLGGGADALGSGVAAEAPLGVLAAPPGCDAGGFRAVLVVDAAGFSGTEDPLFGAAVVLVTLTETIELDPPPPPHPVSRATVSRTGSIATPLPEHLS